MFAEAGWLSVMFFELWFVIPEIEVAGGTAHEQLNDAFGAGGVVQLFSFAPLPGVESACAADSASRTAAAKIGRAHV